MELVERAGFLASLQAKFNDIATGEGHCVLLSGEAGIGKTTLTKAFCNIKKGECRILQGSCDALFTPRPLAPLYDIASQMQNDLLKDWDGGDRTVLFSRLLHQLRDDHGLTIIIFEDIHWADEATFDLIKFLARRISLTKCMFILTYRDNEINARHPLRSVLGQLPPDSFTRMQLQPLSRGAVDAMAEEKGYRGEDVYSISGGNPFYVNEILASYSPGVPANVKDSILAIYNRYPESTRRVLTILSILPTGMYSGYLEKMEPAYYLAIEDCLDSGILVADRDTIHFKHELYRRTIEASFSPLKRVALNMEILGLFKDDFERNDEIERIVHHAKNANEYDIVVQFAPKAAKAAAQVGAHIEAAKLYYTAIEYYQGRDNDTLIELYELYAYECYLTSKNKDAIIYTTKSLNLWKEKNDQEKIGNCMWFLSRLWWFEGKQEKAESYGLQAIEVLDKQPASKAKAMAYGNMSKLKLSMDLTDECLLWGEKAIAMAQEVNDQETISNALNNVGSALMLDWSTQQKGIELIKQSLEIALKNAYHEHAARAYTSIGNIAVSLKEYKIAKEALDEGLVYCEEKDIDSQKLYMLAYQARLNLETGNWKEAFTIADNLLKNEDLLPVLKIFALAVLGTIKIRRGDNEALPLLLEAKTIAFETKELQRIIPALLPLLEYEWLTGKSYVETEVLSHTVNRIVDLGRFSKKSRFYFWLRKAGKDRLLPGKSYEENSITTVMEHAALWENWGCPYEHALSLSEGSEADKKKAIAMLQALGADAVYEKMKLEMRASGIKSIPRGKRESTMTNTAHLTGRELDVLQLLKEGLKNKEIADKLFISPKTVDHHISAVLVKLGVDSRAKAVNEAARLGILK